MTCIPGITGRAMTPGRHMRAVILAAGIGKRLEAPDGRRPKCLLHFGGKSLLARQLESLRRHGVTDVVIVTGYAADLVESEIDALRLNPRPLTVRNADFERGSVVSLWCAREHLARGDDEIVLMDADVLFDDRVLSRLLRSPRSDCILLDRDFEPGEEPVKLCLRAGVVVEFRKRVPEDLEFDDSGESVGFFRFSPATAAELSRRTVQYVDGGKRDEPHEEVIRDLVLDAPARFSFEDVSGLPWIEIDFPDDVRRAEREILPRLSGVPA